MNKVVISGTGFITSIGNDKKDVEKHLRELKHGFSLVDLLPGVEGAKRLIGRPQGFSFPSASYMTRRYPAAYKLPRELMRGLSPHGVYASCAALQAIEDSGITQDELSNGETALFCSSAGSPWLLSQNLKHMRESDAIHGSPFGVISSISGTLNFNLSTYLKIRGGNCGFVSACSSSTHAIGFAIDQIRLGRQKRVIVIGAEEDMPETILPFAAMRVMADTHDPSRGSCPFDVERSGFLACGGAAALIIEDEQSALERGVKPYARLCGWGHSADGYSTAQPDPKGEGLLRAMKLALEDAELPAEAIDYVNAHATSTIAGDAAEATAISNLYSGKKKLPAVSGTKSLTGHGLSLAGAMETGICALALREGFTPGNAHLRTPCKEAESLTLPLTTKDTRPSYILKNNSGFGGSNVSLVMQAV